MEKQEFKKIGIIVAMSKEYDLVRNLLVDAKEEHFLNFDFSVGHIGDKEIVLMKSGIGKVNATIATLELISHFKPDCIINTGVAGGIDQFVRVGDIIVGEESCYHDFYCGEVNDHQAELGYPEFIPADRALHASLLRTTEGMDNVKFGLICTGDQFITNREELFKIKAKHPAGMAVDMESNSIAHTCFMHKTPFVSFRIISDTPWVDNHEEQYLNFWDEAPQRTFDLLRSLLSNL